VPDPWGFIKIEKELPPKRTVQIRVRDWREVYQPSSEATVRSQAARCMDCGIPFCHNGCPLGNLIPEWNDLVYRGDWRAAIDRLHATNNFPEFTGKLCPAPCEPSCVLGTWEESVTIKQIEMAIIDRAFASGWVTPRLPETRTGKSVAIVGSGPAGLAAAQQLNWAGHQVTVFEQSDRIGGLIRYGIPDFKMDKAVLDRRLGLLEAEGIEFRPNSRIGTDIPATQLTSEFDAVVLAIGAHRPRDLPIPGRDLDGIHWAMDYLTQQNQRLAGDSVPDNELIAADGKRVVIIGGGDTGADCFGTAIRQGAVDVVQFQRWPQPPERRAEHNPWPQPPEVFQVSPAHEEGGSREFAISTREFVGYDGSVVALQGARYAVTKDRHGFPKLHELPGTEFEMPVDLVLLAIGFAGPEPGGLVSELGLRLTDRGTIQTNDRRMTGVPGVFAAGDAARGQSLIVWAIAEGRHVAAAVDQYLNDEVVGDEHGNAAPMAKAGDDG
jgi:glutamate synthase (NADPH) small chain